MNINRKKCSTLDNISSLSIFILIVLVCFNSILANDFSNYTIVYHDLGGFIRDINGNAINDYFLVGDFSHVMHYNGSTFYNYGELAGGSRYSAVAQWGDYVFICQAYAPLVVRGLRGS